MDKRQQRTRNLIQEEFLKLRKIQPKKNISVTALCHNAGINRSTFYSHYSDIDELEERMESSLFEEFRQTLDEFVLKDRGWLKSLLGSPTKVSFPVIKEVFVFFKKHRIFFRDFSPTQESMPFLEKFYDMGKDRFMKEVIKEVGKENQDPYLYFYSYVAHGCIGLVKQWNDNAMEESPEEMAALAQHFIERGSYCFIEQKNKHTR